VPRIVHGSLAVALSKWADVCAIYHQGARLRMQIRLKVVLRAIGHKRSHAAWYTWRRLCGDMATRRERMRTALCQLLELNLSRSYLKWHQAALQRVQKQELVRRSVSKLLHAAAAAAMSTWRETTSTLTASFDLRRRVMCRMRHSQFYSTWQRWSAMVKAMSGERDSMRGALHHMAQRELSNAYNLWCSKTMGKIYEAGLVDVAIGRLTEGLLSCRFGQVEAGARSPGASDGGKKLAGLGC